MLLHALLACAAALSPAGREGGVPSLSGLLAPPAPQAGARFGEAVATDGHRLLVGAPGADGAAPKSGAAYVFAPRPDGPAGTTAWVLEAVLTPAVGASGERFGGALALDGALAAVAAPGHAVVLFERDAGGRWCELQRLAPEGGPQAFGADLALEGGRLLVGAPVRDRGEGVCYLLARPGPGARFELRQTLRSPVPHADQHFGARVALSGPLAAVGAPGWRPPDALAGAAPVGAAFLLAANPAGALGVLQPLAPGYGGPVEDYAADLDLDGSTVVVGAPGKQVGGLNGAGAALVLEPGRAAGSPSWEPRVELIASNGQADDGFGASVSVSGDLVLVGAPDTPLGGAVYAFGRDAGGPGAWGELGFVDNPSGFGDLFGAALDHAGAVGLAGAPSADAGSLGGAGMAGVLRGSAR